MLAIKLALCLLASTMTPMADDEAPTIEGAVPNKLFKVLSLENWETSKEADQVMLPEEDGAFIHFSREDQLERIIAKYWSGTQGFVILTIDTAKLPGDLRLEANPGSTNQYYHLYDGKIPTDAIIDCQKMSKE